MTAGLAVAAIAVASASCRHRAHVGGACRVADQIACIAADRAVVCNSGVWVELRCQGAKGCARRGDTDECDDTIAAEQDACPHNPPVDYACTADRSKALVCQHGSFSLWRACRGPARCEVVDGHNVHCDTTLGEPGDLCEKEGSYCCSIDHKSMLRCDGHGLVTASSCRGPEECHVASDARKVDCDDTRADEGDPCDQPKRIACSLDGKSELVCAESKYIKKRECHRGECKLEGNELFCD